LDEGIFKSATVRESNMNENSKNNLNTGKDSGDSESIYISIRPDSYADVCEAVFSYIEQNDDHRTFGNTCRRAAQNCGPNRKKMRLATCKEDLKSLSDDIKDLEKKKSNIDSEMADRVHECPTCARNAEAGMNQGQFNGEGQQKKGIGDYIVGGLQALAPVGQMAIQAGMYNKYINRSSNAYQSMLNSYNSNYSTYTKSCVTLGRTDCSTPSYLGASSALGGLYGSSSLGYGSSSYGSSYYGNSYNSLGSLLGLGITGSGYLGSSASYYPTSNLYGANGYPSSNLYGAYNNSYGSGLSGYSNSYPNYNSYNNALGYQQQGVAQQDTSLAQQQYYEALARYQQVMSNGSSYNNANYLGGSYNPSSYNGLNAGISNYGYPYSQNSGINLGLSLNGYGY